VRISIEGAAALLRRALRLRPRLDLASLPHYPLLEHVVLHVVLLLLRVLRVLRLLRLMRPMCPHLPQPMLRLLIQGGRSRPFLFRLLLLLPGVSSELGRRLWRRWWAFGGSGWASMAPSLSLGVTRRPEATKVP
jgi:hypothetical protein